MKQKIPIVQGSHVFWINVEETPGAFTITCPELSLRIDSPYEGGGIARMRQLITGSQYEPILEDVD